MMSWGYSDVAPSGSTSVELTQANHSYYGGQSGARYLPICSVF